MPVVTPSSEDLRVYEIIVLLPLSLTEKERFQALKEIEGVLTEKGGKQLSRDSWGRQGLAYPIRKHREGEFIVYLYELPPNSASSADAALRLEKHVLRHLFVKVPKHYETTTFAERAKLWEQQKEREKEHEEKEREQVLKQKLAKRVTRASPVKEVLAIVTPEETASLEEKLGEIISDEDLKL